MSEESPEDLFKEIEGDTSHTRFARWGIFQRIAEGFERIGDPAKAENARTEFAAFLLLTEGDHFQGYFQPFAVFTDGHTSPPQDFFDLARVRHLEQRARHSSNPIHASRFADVVWDFSEKKDIDIARIAIDRYLECAELYKKNKWGLELGEALTRSACLSSMIGDLQRIAKVKEHILRYLDELDSAQEYRFCLEMTDAIARSHMVLTDEESQRIMNVLDNAATYYQREHPKRDGSFGPVDGPSEHLVRAFHQSKLRLAHELTSCRSLVDHEQERLKVAYSYEREGDRTFQEGRSLAALLSYTDAEKEFRDLGERSDVDRLRVKLGKAGVQLDAEMKREPPISVEIKLKDSDIEKYIKPILAPTLEETLRRMSTAPHFIPDIGRIEKSFKTTLSTLFPRVSLRDGYVTGKSVDDDELRSTALDEDMLRRMLLLTPFVSHLFTKLKREYSMNSYSLVTHFRQWGFCKSRNLALLRKGFEHYFQEDYVTALHILVFQFEDVLRNLLREANRPVTKPPQLGRIGGAATLGSLLLDEEFRQKAGPSLIRYYTLILVDPNGLNLRNNVAHAVMEVEEMRKQIVELVLYVLLSLTRFRIDQKNSEEKPNGSSTNTE
jgi:hypothetical protein